MNRRLCLASTACVAALAIAGVPHAASAQPVTGPYISLGGGGNILQDERLQGEPFNRDGKLSFDDGPAAMGGVGYGFGNGFRVQIEGDWRQNRLHTVSNFPGPLGAGGRQQNYGGMADAIFDMDIGQSWIYPYFGAGAGYSWTRWQQVNAFGAPGTNVQSGFIGDGKDGHFAYQGLFGVSLPIPFVVGLSFTAEYRFFSVLGKTSFPGEYQRGDLIASGRLGGSTAYNHTGLLGLRYALFQPTPPMPATAPPQPQAQAPEVQPSRTYLVFFDWDRADLTARARSIVSEAAQASTHIQTTRIEVNGYTDLSGTEAYNQRLSVRRAQSVEAELVRDGVNRTEISIHGFGESSPLVQTARGVREPQNRRVEIVLR